MTICSAPANSVDTGHFETHRHTAGLQTHADATSYISLSGVEEFRLPSGRGAAQKQTAKYRKTSRRRCFVYGSLHRAATQSTTMFRPGAFEKISHLHVHVYAPTRTRMTGSKERQKSSRTQLVTAAPRRGRRRCAALQRTRERLRPSRQRTVPLYT